MKKIICRVCGLPPNKIRGYLKRVNTKGQPGRWQCYPHCKNYWTNEKAVIKAIKGK